MKFNKLMIAMVAIAVSATGCKRDSESDLIPPPSSTTGLFINEVYSSNPDWIELYNSTDAEIDLSDFTLQDDKGAAEEYKIPSGTTIAAKSYLVIDMFSFGLSSSNGDVVKLFDQNGGVINEVTIPVMESGKSYGRETDGGAAWTKWDTPTKGRSNTSIGEDDITPSAIRLFINEVVSSPSEGNDWIELYNDSDTELNLEGIVIYDGGGVSKGYTFPAGVKISAKSLMVVETFSGNTAGPTFGLSSGGDDVMLIDRTGAEIDKVTIPALGADQAYARVGNGGAQWQIVDTPSKGTDNPTTAVESLKGKIVVNEVYTFSNQSTIEDLDWIELYNTTDAEIAIGGLLLWESGGREEAWVIPNGKKIAAKSRLLIECDKYALHSDPTNYPAWGLSKGPDEYIVLASADFTQIDSVKCPSLNENESYGRKTDGAAQWQIFAQHTKGTANIGDARAEHVNTTGIYINEVYTDNSTKTGIADWDATIDFIELYNSTNSPIDISGWEIYDDTADDSKKYVVPAGTIVPAKGFLVYDVFKDNPNGPQFGLGVGGDWVFIYNKPGKQEVDLVDKIEIPGLAKGATPQQRDMGYSYGRFTDGSSSLTFFKQASKGASNNGKEIVVFE